MIWDFSHSRSCDLFVGVSTPMQLKTAEVEYSDVLLRWLKENITRKSQARVMATRDNVARREATITTELRYQVEGVWSPVRLRGVWSTARQLRGGGVYLVLCCLETVGVH